MAHAVRRALGAALCLAVLGAVTLRAGPAAAQSAPASAQAALLARGKVLMEGIVACGNCHVARGPQGEPLSDKGLSGGMVFDERSHSGLFKSKNSDGGAGQIRSSGRRS